MCVCCAVYLALTAEIAIQLKDHTHIEEIEKNEGARLFASECVSLISNE